MPPVRPMLAKLVKAIPEGDYLYEPKWDGFRAIVFRDGDEVEIGSRTSKSLVRYFPELVDACRAQLPPRCVIDGEIVVVTERGLDFDALGLRVHPADSRVRKLAQEIPASFVAFDLLALGDDDLRQVPLSDRHARLERVLADVELPVFVTPSTESIDVARDWFDRFEGAGFDGVIAKPRDVPYVEDQRVMAKIKHEHTTDVVVAGYRMHKDGRGVGSLLLGLYDDTGSLHHVGVAASMAAKLRASLLDDVAPYELDDPNEHPWAGWAEWGTPAQPIDRGARMPGSPSRWTGQKDLAWIPLRIGLVAEVRYEHLQPTNDGSPGRFRHVARFVRWRPDREPASCTYAQLEAPPAASFAELLGGA